MERKVIQFIETHHLLIEKTNVLVGVSGGPDSMALLHFLLSIREEWQLNVTVLTIDHQLRGEVSVQDADYVEEICLKWNVDCVRTSLDVNHYKKKHHVSTQIAAREVRYQFFEEQMNTLSGDYLALGHHGDDQVETMMMRFVRSASSNALTGIPVQRIFAKGSIIRPLLTVSKSEVIDYCNRNEIEPRIDVSNDDPTYTRNYFRKYLVPLITEQNNNIHTTMQHLSESLEADELFLQSEAEKMFQEVVDLTKEKKQVSFNINVYKSYSLSLQRRCYHLILKYLYDSLPNNITYTHETIFSDLLDENQGNGHVDFPNDLKVEKVYSEIFFYFIVQNEEHKKNKQEIKIPGETKLPSGARLLVSYLSDEGINQNDTLICDVNKLALPLHIRTRQPGDRMNWKGLDGSKKIKDLFIDLKIPRREREIWPIVVDQNDKILWLVGLRKSIQQNNSSKPNYIQLEYKGLGE